jgi:hypothetical protein
MRTHPSSSADRRTAAGRRDGGRGGGHHPARRPRGAAPLRRPDVPAVVAGPELLGKERGDRLEVRQVPAEELETVKLKNVVPPIHFESAWPGSPPTTWRSWRRSWRACARAGTSACTSWGTRTTSGSPPPWPRSSWTTPASPGSAPARWPSTSRPTSACRRRPSPTSGQATPSPWPETTPRRAGPQTAAWRWRSGTTRRGKA